MNGTKIQDLSHVLQRIPVNILQDLQNDSTMRGPGRLFLYLRRFLGSKYHPSTQKHILLVHFSRYQIEKYLAALLRRKYLRQDAAGNFYLNSLRTICPDQTNDSGKRVRMLYHCLDDQALRDGQYWKKVIAGVVVAAYTRSLRYGRTGKRAACFAATNDPTGIGTVYQGRTVITPDTLANSSMVQGCALTILARHTGRHKSTMSRWRKKGQAVGYSLGRWFYKQDDTYYTPARIAAWRKSGYWCESGQTGLDLNRVVIRDGKVWVEGPSQLIFERGVFFKK